MSFEEAKVQVDVYQRPKSGNHECGDSYVYYESDNQFICALADGLGSGRFAKESSEIVVDVIRSNAHHSIEELIIKCNEVLLSKRGVVLGIIKIDFDKQRFSYTTVGNIGIIVVDHSGKKVRNIPNAGYLSGYARPYKIKHETLPKDALFLMYSDGVNERFFHDRSINSRSCKEIIDYFKGVYGDQIDDDTTLIAFQYHGDG
ncbi:PP2C family serine/threonine-protein phosphatase [Bacillaceae bacterium S4-13-58]